MTKVKTESEVPKKKDLFDYSPVGIKVGNNKVTHCPSVPALQNTTLYLNPEGLNTIGVLVDLNTIDISLFNPNTRRWRLKKNPTVRSFVRMVETGEHPLCEIPEQYRIPGGLKTYVKDRLFKEYNDAKPEDATEIVVTTEGQTGNRYPKMAWTHRFQRGIAKGINKFAETSKPLLDLLGYPFSGLASPYLASSSKKYEIIPDVRPPVVSEEEKANLVKEAKACWRQRSSWNWDPPSAVEFDDNTEMIQRVMEHLSMFPGLDIVYLRKRNLAYYSDGSFSLTPDAAPKDYKPPFISSNPGRPLIYSGEAWVLYFTINGKDFQQGVHIYFCTPEQYVEAMKSMGREDLVEGDWKPWGDLFWISSDWCERNGKVNYGKGYDLSTPHRRRLTLAKWLLGPFIQHCMESGQGNPLEGIATLVSAKIARGRWQQQAAARKALAEYQDSMKAILAEPLPEKDPNSVEPTSVLVQPFIEIDTGKLSPGKQKHAAAVIDAGTVTNAIVEEAPAGKFKDPLDKYYDEQDQAEEQIIK